MSYEDRPVSDGPARDDPELGDTLAPRTGAAEPDWPETPTTEPDWPEAPASETSGTPGREAAGEVAGTARERAGEVASTGREKAGEVAGTAREKAGDVATTGREQARSVAGTAQGEAREVAREARGQARRLAHDARSELRSQADSQVSRLADGLDDLTRQLRSMGERGEPGPVNDMVQQAASQAQRIAGRLREGGLDDAVGQVRDFGRNRPGLFLLGAFGLGLVSGRVARNLAQEPSGDGNGNGQQQQSRSPVAATGQPGTAGGQGTPVSSIPEGDAYAVPTTGHTAYGAPVGDERWGG
jgi:hypothetical protein